MTEQEKLIDVLDDVTASLETVLLHHGKQMTPADYMDRKALAVKARNLVSASRDVGDIHPLDAKEWHAEFHSHASGLNPYDGAEKVIHIVHLWEETTDGGHVETHTDEICELQMDYADANVRQHASILAGSIRVLKAAEALIRTALPATLAARMFNELVEAVKVSRTPFQDK